MKEALELINPELIIKEALKENEEANSKRVYHKRSELLEQTRTSSINNYLESIKGKSVKEITKDFQNKIDEYNRGVQVIIDKTEKENLQYAAQANSLKEKNALLEAHIAQMNIEHIQLEQQLKESNNQIYNLQAKFEIFNDNKELFEEFLKEFPGEKPIEIMKDLAERKNESKALINEVNSLKEKIDRLQKEKMENEKNMKKSIEELSLKNYQMEKEKKGIEENFLKKEIQIKNELSLYQDYKKENILLHNMLFQIYNLLFETLRLDKGIDIKEEFLDIQEKDFKPNLFNNPELFNYVKLMIKSMKSTISDQIYRECIAYANMMVRKYLTEKINLRFQPVEIFKEIKLLVDKKEEQLNKCKQDMHLFQEKIRAMEKENIKIKNQLRNESISFENYKKIVDKLFTNNNLNKLNLVEKELKNIKNETEKSNKRYLQTSIEKKPKLSIATTNNVTAEDIDSTKPSNVNTVPNRKKGYSDELNKRNLIKSTLSLNQFDPDNPNKPNKKEKITIISQEKQKSSSLNSETNEASELNEDEAKEFRELKKSKNKDKLIKTHGCQGFISNLTGIKELVEHTNRIFMYKSKMKKTVDPEKKDRFNIQLENRFRPSSPENIEIKEKNPFKDRALLKINNLLSQIKAQDN